MDIGGFQVKKMSYRIMSFEVMIFECFYHSNKALFSLLLTYFYLFIYF